MKIEKFISPLIEKQFPSFYREEGQNFIEFVKTYYEFLEQSGNVIEASRSILEYGDIDETKEEFLKYFKNKYINSLPENVLTDKRLLIKHVANLYNSKGSERGYRLLFRLLFNEDIDFYIPGEHLFKPSESKWNVPRYIEVTASKYLDDMIGYKIHNGNGSSALVESVYTKNINGKSVNIVYISNLIGAFSYGDKIYCDEVPEINSNNAVNVFGSLSGVSLTSGGINYNVGDLLNVSGAGQDAVARVSSVEEQNGRVRFKLVNGGFGYSLNAITTVTGGGGAGADFEVGGLTNKQIFVINNDIINPLVNVNLEYANQNMQIGMSNVTGTFANGQLVTSSTNATHIDVAYISGVVTVGESLSNSTLGISNLYVYKSEDSVIYVSGPDDMLTSANLVSNTILVSNSTLSSVKINSTYPKVTITGNGIVNAAASSPTSLALYNPSSNIGYFAIGSTITSNGGATANVTSVTRIQDWRLSNTYPLFPVSTANVNLDTTIEQALKLTLLEVGTITYLKNINPGSGYSSDPTVTVTEPDIKDLQISDGFGGFWGQDAVVTASAGNEKGIVTGVTLIDSGFGYKKNENLIMTNPTNETTVFGVGIVENAGIGTGYWSDNISFISDDKRIQDSNFYQIFSYEIGSARMIETYRNLVESLVHPTGIALFGKFSIKSTIINEPSENMFFSLTQQ